MPARLKLKGPTTRHGIFLYDDDVALIESAYPHMSLSGFIRELAHRHCEALRTRNRKPATEELNANS